MNEVINDPLFYYAVPFALFLSLAWWKGRKPLAAWLDAEILKISHELEQAKKLRAEAEALLAEGKAKQVQALSDAESIVRQAKSESAHMKIETEAHLKNQLALHEQLIAERIRIAETEAIDTVRLAVIDLAVRLARENMAAQIDEAVAVKLVDQVLADLPPFAKAKAQAA